MCDHLRSIQNKSLLAEVVLLICFVIFHKQERPHQNIRRRSYELTDWCSCSFKSVIANQTRFYGLERILWKQFSTIPWRETP